MNKLLILISMNKKIHECHMREAYAAPLPRASR